MRSPLASVLRLYRDAFSGVPRPVWWLGLTVLLNRAGTMVLPLLSLYATQEQGLTAAEAGQVVGLFGVGSLIGSWVGGWACDRISAVDVQWATMLLSGLSLASVPLATSKLELGLLVLASAIVMDAYRPAVMVNATHLCRKHERVRVFGFMRLAFNLGWGIGPAIGGFVATVSYRWVFYGNGAACWVAMVALLWLRPRLRQRVTDSDPEQADRATRRGPWFDAPYLLLLGALILFACAFFQVLGTMPLYLHEHRGLPEDNIGTLMAVNAGIIVVFEMILIRALERFDRLSTIAWGALITGVGLCVLQLAGPALAVALLSVALWTLGEMITMPLVNAVVAERSEHRDATGAYMGLLMVSYSVAFIVAPLWGTWVYQEHGPAWVWTICGALGVVVFGCFRSLSKPMRGDRQTR